MERRVGTEEGTWRNLLGKSLKQVAGVASRGGTEGALKQMHG